MKKKSINRSVFAVVALCCLGGLAHADIYKFVDENNVVHFSNVPDDPRYTVFMKEPRYKTRVNGAQSIASSSANRERFRPLIASMAKYYKVDEALLHALILAESGYNPNAVSPKGATGLMQLMPDTAKRYGVTNIADPTANLHGGTRYLRDLLLMFKNNVHLALAAYNAGENAVIASGNQIPPYAETQNYVSKVIGSYYNSKVSTQ
jgi:soluble lytic murein transglycosylase-like protein